MKFADLRLAEPILRALVSEGYVSATPIQAQAIPHAMQGRDVLGCAQTGTGKTAAFALPVLHRFFTGQKFVAGAAPRVRCLVLCPTRELATQISDSFRGYGKNLALRQAVIFGGVNQNPQVASLRKGLDVLVATPGRLLDLMNQGHVDLRGVEVLVLDEADRMLDMGFIHDIRRIVAKLPANKQTMLFSATMPAEIRSLADSLMRNPAKVQVAPVSATADRIDESVYFVDRKNKPALLAHLVDHLPMTRALVFTRTKHGADRVVRQLHTRGIRAEAIHGNKSQNARERALGNFKSNKTPVLVATDVASRGIDVDGITHVVNYDLTHEPETYVHRIGRTARAGASGAAVSFCDGEERENLRAIEKLIRRPIPVKSDHPHYPAVEEQPRSHSQHPRHAGPARHHAAPARAPQGTNGTPRDRQGPPVGRRTAAQLPKANAASRSRRQGGHGQSRPRHASAPVASYQRSGGRRWHP